MNMFNIMFFFFFTFGYFGTITREVVQFAKKCHQDWHAKVRQVALEALSEAMDPPLPRSVAVVPTE